jgi:hypothetical protein
VSRAKAQWSDTDLQILSRMWGEGYSLAAMSQTLRMSKSWVSEMAMRQGLPTRRRGIRYGRRKQTVRQQNMTWVGDTVTKRCNACGGSYQTEAGDYEPHPECRLARKVA